MRFYQHRPDQPWLSESLEAYVDEVVLLLQIRDSDDA